MDVIDQAQDFEQAARARKIASMRIPKYSDPNENRECVDCGEDIPEERRIAAPWTKRCVDCQSLAERR